MYGFVQPFFWILTVVLNSGTRMWRRGANLEGDTANFIETEQLLELGGYISSFLQVCFTSQEPTVWAHLIHGSFFPNVLIRDSDASPS